MMVADELDPVEPENPGTHLPMIGSIQSRQDGTYVITYGDYPFHATQAETPDIYARVLAEIHNGAPVSAYIEPEILKPDPLAAAIDEYNRLRGVADFVMAPLQDAVDEGIAAESEVALLSAWKQYRIALSRVHEQEGYPLTVNWPDVPV
ncbi:tail fiber assembly protein [Pseudomonas sp. EA_65y_Pfl1_P120]|uniref:tail fiber assembly protein n=1 Tax=Pseudomonas sp. EA_65y_Pfl1_P120 TaxID=3088693 RepID=UPI0030DAA8BC